MTPDAPLGRWLERHRYLTSIAQFQLLLDDEAGGPPPARGGAKLWDAHTAAAPGTPLLRGAGGLELVRGAAGALHGLVGRIAAATLPAALAGQVRELRAALGQSPEAAAGAIEWSVFGAEPAPAMPVPGLLRLLCWTTLRRHLAPVVGTFGAWPGREQWRLGHCPTCGALPVMAQLVPGENGRQRLLSCGCCRTRWGFRRVGCPFCNHESGARVDVLEVEGEELRLDACQECHGYLKTYTATGAEELFLADWSTLHLDVLARERGYSRRGDSLYDLDDAG